MRSVPQILGVIYSRDPEALGRRVRDRHRSIKGLDHQGRPYRALEPATFWWAHATFQHAVKQVVDRFDRHRLSAAERESLYLDGVEWYRRYGVSMRPGPADYAAFRIEWQRQCQEVLEMTPAAERAIDLTLHGRSGSCPSCRPGAGHCSRWSSRRFCASPPSAGCRTRSASAWASRGDWTKRPSTGPCSWPCARAGGWCCRACVMGRRPPAAGAPPS